ncbi:MAG: hypothetical protein JWP94_2697 [Mucilaginibacter sp.]|jgi:hypothetical protein|nr:hypothetical protein [Mucilaginibacter sp.]
MKTVFDKETRDELIARINSIDENKSPKWGKMNVYQMLKHCYLSDELYLGKKKYDRIFLGRIFGRIALKRILKEGAPFPKNAKTSQHFIVTGNGNAEEEKRKLISLINGYETFSQPFVEHWFFGKMTKEQVGALSYKHLDHHLQQFGS